MSINEKRPVDWETEYTTKLLYDKLLKNEILIVDTSMPPDQQISEYEANLRYTSNDLALQVTLGIVNSQKYPNLFKNINYLMSLANYIAGIIDLKTQVVNKATCMANFLQEHPTLTPDYADDNQVNHIQKFFDTYLPDSKHKSAKWISAWFVEWKSICDMSESLERDVVFLDVLRFNINSLLSDNKQSGLDSEPIDEEVSEGDLFTMMWMKYTEASSTEEVVMPVHELIDAENQLRYNILPKLIGQNQVDFIVGAIDLINEKHDRHPLSDEEKVLSYAVSESNKVLAGRGSKFRWTMQTAVQTITEGGIPVEVYEDIEGVATIWMFGCFMLAGSLMTMIPKTKNFGHSIYLSAFILMLMIEIFQTIALFQDQKLIVNSTRLLELKYFLQMLLGPLENIIGRGVLNTLSDGFKNIASTSYYKAFYDFALSARQVLDATPTSQFEPVISKNYTLSYETNEPDLGEIFVEKLKKIQGLEGRLIDSVPSFIYYSTALVFTIFKGAKMFVTRAMLDSMKYGIQKFITAQEQRNTENFMYLATGIAGTFGLFPLAKNFIASFAKSSTRQPNPTPLADEIKPYQYISTVAKWIGLYDVEVGDNTKEINEKTIQEIKPGVVSNNNQVINELNILRKQTAIIAYNVLKTVGGNIWWNTFLDSFLTIGKYAVPSIVLNNYFYATVMFNFTSMNQKVNTLEYLLLVALYQLFPEPFTLLLILRTSINVFSYFTTDKNQLQNIVMFISNNKNALSNESSTEKNEDQGLSLLKGTIDRETANQMKALFKKERDSSINGFKERFELYALELPYALVNAWKKPAQFLKNDRNELEYFAQEINDELRVIFEPFTGYYLRRKIDFVKNPQSSFEKGHRIKDNTTNYSYKENLETVLKALVIEFLPDSDIKKEILAKLKTVDLPEDREKALLAELKISSYQATYWQAVINYCRFDRSPQECKEEGVDSTALNNYLSYGDTNATQGNFSNSNEMTMEEIFRSFGELLKPINPVSDASKGLFILCTDALKEVSNVKFVYRGTVVARDNVGRSFVNSFQKTKFESTIDSTIDKLYEHIEKHYIDMMFIQKGERDQLIIEDVADTAMVSVLTRLVSCYIIKTFRKRLNEWFACLQKLNIFSTSAWRIYLYVNIVAPYLLNNVSGHRLTYIHVAKA